MIQNPTSHFEIAPAPTSASPAMKNVAAIVPQRGAVFVSIPFQLSNYPGGPSARSRVLTGRRSLNDIGGASSCWIDYRGRSADLQRKPLPHQEAILKSLPGWIVTGSDRSRGPCSARNLGWRCTTSSGTISRSVHAPNMSQRLRHRAGNHSHISSARLSAATMASRSFSRSWPDAKRNGGSTFKNNSASAQASRN